MTLTELAAEVLVWTKRPDKDAAARSAIRRSLLKYHRGHKFFRDLLSINVANPTPGQPVAIFPIAASFPGFRQFARISLSGLSRRLEPTTIDNLIDLDGFARQNVYLIAGTNLNILTLVGFQAIDVTYYADPVFVGDNLNSWIADSYPDLIAAGAAASILAFDNESEIYKAAKQEEAEQWKVLVSNNLEPEAR